MHAACINILALRHVLQLLTFETICCRSCILPGSSVVVGVATLTWRHHHGVPQLFIPLLFVCSMDLLNNKQVAHQICAEQMVALRAPRQSSAAVRVKKLIVEQAAQNKAGGRTQPLGGE